MMEIQLQSWRPNFELGAVLARHEEATTPYRYGEEHRLFKATMVANYPFIIAMALRGNPTRVIAAGYGVSREAIDRKLRPLGMKNPPGVRGRPKSSPPASSRSTSLAAAMAPR